LVKKKNPKKKPLYLYKYRTNLQIKEVLIEMYEEINNKERKTFSPGIFMGFQGKMNSVILARYLFEEKLNWGLSTTVRNLNKDLLDKNNLRTVRNCFDHIYELVIACYPDKELKPYYFKNARGIWHDKKGKINYELVHEAIREFITALVDPKGKFGKYKHNMKKMPQWISYQLFQKPVLPFDNNLSYMLNYVYKNSAVNAIIHSYPELKLKPYYFRNAPDKYWRGEAGKKHAIEAAKEFVDILTDPKGKYKWSMNEVFQYIKYTSYFKPILPFGAKLSGMLQVCFKNSPSAPIRMVSQIFGEKYKLDEKQIGKGLA
jgi:hypothetical protein